MAKERKITEAERKRTDRFQTKAAALKEEGYEAGEHTMSIVRANILAVFIMLPFVAVIGIPYILLHGIGQITSFTSYMISLVLFVILMAVETVIHEGIHGLTWGLLAPDGFRAIEFGFIKEYLTPYCYCASPLTKGAYLVGSILPTLILGFAQGIVAICTGNFMIFLLAVVMMFGGGGDFLIDFLLIRYKKKRNTLIIMDHPTELGFVAFEKD